MCKECGYPGSIDVQVVWISRQNRCAGSTIHSGLSGTM